MLRPALAGWALGAVLLAIAPRTRADSSAPHTATAATGLPAPPTCPENDKLKRRLAGALRVAEVAVLGCVAARIPEPGWVVMTWIGPQSMDDKLGPWQLLLDCASGKVVRRYGRFTNSPRRIRAPWSLTLKRFQAQDLDGDGTDELLIEMSADQDGTIIDHVTIGRLGPRRFAVLLDRESFYTNSPTATTGAVPLEERKTDVQIGEPGADGRRSLRVTEHKPRYLPAKDGSKEPVVEWVIADRKELRLDGKRFTPR